MVEKKNKVPMEFGSVKFKNWMVSSLRKLTFSWMPRNEAKRKARVQDGTFKTGRPKYKYKCAICDGVFKSGEVQVDHTVPVIDPLHGFESYDILIERMFCQEDGLQVLCKKCHDEKTRGEKELKKQRKVKT